MSEAIDHDDSGPGTNPAPNPPVADNGPLWLEEQFDGLPSTIFACTNGNRPGLPTGLFGPPTHCWSTVSSTPTPITAFS